MSHQYVAAFRLGKKASANKNATGGFAFWMTPR